MKKEEASYIDASYLMDSFKKNLGQRWYRSDKVLHHQSNNVQHKTQSLAIYQRLQNQSGSKTSKPGHLFLAPVVEQEGRPREEQTIYLTNARGSVHFQ